LKRNLAISLIIILLLSSLLLLSGCGALITAIVKLVLGLKLGFVAIPAVAVAKVDGSQAEDTPGMIIIPVGEPPPGYQMAEGAVVTLEGATGTVTTGSDGKFSFVDVPVGIKNLRVDMPGFISIQQEVVVSEENTGSNSFTGFKIVPDGPITASMFVDRISVPQANVYFETYGLDPNGNAIKPDALWSVTPEDTEVTISPEGVFRSTKEGRFTVTATSVLDNSISTSVQITVVEYAMTVQGSVTDESGNPVAGATVQINESNLVATTDANGSYIIPGAPASSVIRVTAVAALRKGTAASIVNDFTQPAVINVVIKPVTPGPPPSGGIMGRVYQIDEVTPIAGAYVAFYSLTFSANSLTAQATPDLLTITDLNGDYSISDVPEGACRLEMWPTEASYNSSPNGPIGIADASVIAGTVITVNINSKYTSVVSGTVYDETGNPLIGCPVSLKPVIPSSSFNSSQQVEHNSTTDGQGRFSFIVAAGGQYYIEAKSADGTISYYSNAFEVVIGSDIEVLAGFAPGPTGPTGPTGPPGPAGITGPTGVTGPETGTLRVYVQDSGGSPVLGAEVHLTRLGITGSELFASDTSGPGWIEFNVNPGTYQVDVSMTGYQSHTETVQITTGYQQITVTLYLN